MLMTAIPRTLILGLVYATLFASAHVAHAQTKPTTTTAPKPTVLTAPSDTPPNVPLPPGLTPIFDGKTLDGWTMEPPNATNISRGEITDLPALARRLTEKSDPVSAWLADQLDDPTKAALAAYSPTGENQKELGNALAKQLTKIVTGPSVYDEARFKDVKLRDETQSLLKRNPQGRDLARLNRVLLEDAYPNELWPSPAVAWRVRNGI